LDEHYFLMSPQFCVGSPKVVVFDSFLAVGFSICAHKYNNNYFCKSKGRELFLSAN